MLPDQKEHIDAANAGIIERQKLLELGECPVIRAELEWLLEDLHQLLADQSAVTLPPADGLQ